MHSMNIEIISPEGIIFAGSCQMTTIPSVDGEIGVMRAHESLIAKLKNGKIIVYDAGQKIIKEIDVVSGFAEISGVDKLVILVD
jgi:F0F1-type ATP synthase epsilon subunit